MDLERIATKERCDVQQIFVRACRLFGSPSHHPSYDYEQWSTGKSRWPPQYLSSYVQYWERLNLTETL